MSHWSIAATLAAYAACLLLIGFAANRGAARTPDEYFLAGRRLGPFVLFMALFGTNAGRRNRPPPDNGCLRVFVVHPKPEQTESSPP